VSVLVVFATKVGATASLDEVSQRADYNGNAHHDDTDCYGCKHLERPADERHHASQIDNTDPNGDRKYSYNFA
jgi:hypothetical protein